MDELVAKISAFGVPGLVLLVAIEMSGYYGGAAILVALFSIGPGGVIGGIITLGLIMLISHGIAEYGFEAIAKAVILELYSKGEKPDEIKLKIRKLPITHSLKLRLYEVIDSISVKNVLLI